MAALTEGNYLGDWLKEEFEPPQYCREEVTIASGAGKLASGTVLGKVTSSGKYVAFDDDAETGAPGTGVAAGILINAVDATSADAKGVALVRGPAVVVKQGLTWEASNDATEITAGLADLAALKIVVREAV